MHPFVSNRHTKESNYLLALIIAFKSYVHYAFTLMNIIM